MTSRNECDTICRVKGENIFKPKRKGSTKFIRKNERIRFSPLQVIDDEGGNLGVISNLEAQNAARERGLDLVEIDPKARPPICKIMDYGKYKYDLSKKEKQRRQNQKEVELKEIRLTLKIQDHDLDYKAKKAKGFFDKGHKVKVAMRLKGRENIFFTKALEVFEKFSEVSGLEYEAKPRKLGNMINAMVFGIREDGQDK